MSLKRKCHQNANVTKMQMCQNTNQCVANIRIFEYIRIFIDEYIHSPKYLLIFPERMYSDIHSRMFSPHEYIRIFIQNVRFQQIHSKEADQENISFYPMFVWTI